MHRSRHHEHRRRCCRCRRRRRPRQPAARWLTTSLDACEQLLSPKDWTAVQLLFRGTYFNSTKGATGGKKPTRANEATRRSSMRPILLDEAGSADVHRRVQPLVALQSGQQDGLLGCQADQFLHENRASVRGDEAEAAVAAAATAAIAAAAAVAVVAPYLKAVRRAIQDALDEADEGAGAGGGDGDVDGGGGLDEEQGVQRLVGWRALIGMFYCGVDETFVQGDVGDVEDADAPVPVSEPHL